MVECSFTIYGLNWTCLLHILNTLSANPTKWSNTLKLAPYWNFGLNALLKFSWKQCNMNSFNKVSIIKNPTLLSNTLTPMWRYNMGDNCWDSKIEERERRSWKLSFLVILNRSSDFLTYRYSDWEHACGAISPLTLKRLSMLSGLGNFTKKSLWHRCFPVKFAKFLRTPFLQNISGRLILRIEHLPVM